MWNFNFLFNFGHLLNFLNTKNDLISIYELILMNKNIKMKMKGLLFKYSDK